jgi:hypothetical protein
MVAPKNLTLRVEKISRLRYEIVTGAVRAFTRRTRVMFYRK